MRWTRQAGDRGRNEGCAATEPCGSRSGTMGAHTTIRGDAAVFIIGDLVAEGAGPITDVMYSGEPRSRATVKVWPSRTKPRFTVLPSGPTMKLRISPTPFPRTSRSSMDTITSPDCTLALRSAEPPRMRWLTTMSDPLSCAGGQAGEGAISGEKSGDRAPARPGSRSPHPRACRWASGSRSRAEPTPTCLTGYSSGASAMRPTNLGTRFHEPGSFAIEGSAGECRPSPSRDGRHQYSCRDACCRTSGSDPWRQGGRGVSARGAPVWARSDLYMPRRRRLRRREPRAPAGRCAAGAGSSAGRRRPLADLGGP